MTYVSAYVRDLIWGILLVLSQFYTTSLVIGLNVLLLK